MPARASEPRRCKVHVRLLAAGLTVGGVLQAQATDPTRPLDPPPFKKLSGDEGYQYFRAPSRRSDLTAFRVDGMGWSHQIEGMTQAGSATTEASAVRLLSREEAEREDRHYWHSKTPAERLAAAEQLRQVAYGYNAATARIQAVVVRTVLKEG